MDVNPGSQTPPSVVERTRAYVRAELADDTTGHDIWHVERVTRLALRLAAEEKADPLVVELAALLHDIRDWKFHDGDSTAGARAADDWLKRCGVDGRIRARVCTIVGGLSFKGAGVPAVMDTLEGQVVQDADRLDAIGAIGIARAFAYGGARGRALHDPEQPPELHQTFEAYRASSGSTLNHFYEKLLLLEDRMNTAAGRRIAAERHAYLERFVQRFLREWDAKA